MSTIPPDDDLTPIPPPEPPVPGAAAGATQPAVPVYNRKEPKMLKVGPVIAIAVAALVLGAVGGFFIGNSSGGSSGPKTFADALTQFRAGKLPAGNTAGGGGGGGGFPGGAGGGSGTGATPGTGGGAGGGGGFGQGLIGTVSSVNGDTLTLTTRAGNVKVTITPSTTVTKSAPGAISDLTKGTNVRVTAAGSGSGGNSSGSSVTANSIAEVPADAANAPGGGGAAGGGGSGN
jgi:hypothetical protein